MKFSLRKTISATVAATLLAALSPLPTISPIETAIANDPEISPPVCGDARIAPLTDLNVVSAGDIAITNTSVGGRVLAVGNATLSSWSIGDALAVDPARFDLQTGAAINADNGQASNGSISYVTTASSTLWAPNGTIQQRSPGPDPSAVIGDVAEFVAAAADRPANATFTDANPWWTTLQFEGTHGDLNVFHVDASVLATAKGIRVRVPTGATAVIVVHGNSYSTATAQLSSVQFWNGTTYTQADTPGTAMAQDQRRHLLWMFPEAETVQIGPNLAFEGAVWAPHANVTVTQSTDLRGSVISGGQTVVAGSISNFPVAVDTCLPPVDEPPVIVTCDGLEATLIGTDGNDDLFGTDGPDVIFAGEGNDTVDGYEGDDVICGGSGSDTLVGGTGADTIRGDSGDDFLDGATGYDMLDGGDGDDDCTAGPETISCEHDSQQLEANEFDTFLEDLPTAEPGSVSVAGFDGVTVVVETAGGIRSIDVDIATDNEASSATAAMAASDVYDFTVTADAPPILGATITIPYDEARIGAIGETTDSPEWPAGLPKLPVGETELEIHWLDPELGLWISAGDDQIVDTDNNTVTVTVDHFSRYAVMAPPGRVLAELPDQQPTCTTGTGPLPADVVIAIDQSFAAHLADPAGRRFMDAEAFITALQIADQDARLAVVGYDSSAADYAEPAAIGDGSAARDAVSEAGRVGTAEPDIAQGLVAAQRLLGERSASRQQHIVLFSVGHDARDLEWFRYRHDPLADIGIDASTRIHAVTSTDAGNEHAYTGTYPTELTAHLLELADSAHGTVAEGRVAELVEELVGDRDHDGDLVADCEEEDGVITSQTLLGLVDPDGSLAQNGETFSSVRLHTDPNDADSDDDTLTDGAELGSYIDLHAFYEFRCGVQYTSAECRSIEGYLDRGIDGYYRATSLPTSADSDQDLRSDNDELDGYTLTYVTGTPPNQTAHQIQSFTDPLDDDSDDDGIDDGTEFFNEMLGDDPDPSELRQLGLIETGAGIPPFVLAQPYFYSDPDAPTEISPPPAVQLAFFYPDRGRDQNINGVLDRFLTNRWNQDMTMRYESGYECRYYPDDSGICDQLAEAAHHGDDTVWECGWWCPTYEERLHQSVERIVDRQGVFDDDGRIRPQYVQFLAMYQCALFAHPDSLPSCGEIDEPDSDGGIDLAAIGISLIEQLMDMPGGYRPANNCPDPTATGGIYDILDAADNIVYVGKSVDPDVRAYAHNRGRFPKDQGFSLQRVERFATDDPAMQTLLEQRRFDEVWGDVSIGHAQDPANYPNGAASQNLRRPISQDRWNRVRDSGQSPKDLAAEFGVGC